MSTPALDMAREYVARNMRVVPVPAGSKEPVLKAWPELRLGQADLPAHFSNGSNIGIILGTPSDGLVDVDLDCAEAELVARYFLPQTKMWSGRDKRPRSHAWYRAVGDAPKTIKLIDPRKKEGEDHATLLELRSTGGQTLVAPSRHPTGDVYRWDGSLDPAPIAGDDLAWIVRKIGAATLLARYWPAPPPPDGHGSRHNIALALAGMLLRSGWTQSDAEIFLEAVAAAGGDDEIADRVAAVASTARRIADREEATGAPKLAELMGEDIVKAVKKWLGLRGGAGEYVRSDAGNAERFVDEHGDDVLYVPGIDWYVWTGTHWSKDESEVVVQRAIETMRRQTSEALAATDADRNKRIAFALKSEGSPRIRGALELVRSNPRIVAPVSALDTDLWALNVANGTLDLRTGTLRPQQREDRITTNTGIFCDANATAPRFMRFLQETFTVHVGDRVDDVETSSLIAYVQRIVGYILTGSTAEQVVILFYGTGENGKSVLIDVLSALLGELAKVIDIRALLFTANDSRTGAGPSDHIARLRGARLVTTCEVEQGRRFDEATLKNLTGGDRITACFKFKSGFDYKPAFKIVIAANHLPQIYGTDRGIWRRIRVVPFSNIVQEPDKTLAATIIANEMPGVLAWAVEGCRRWQTEGLGKCNAVELLTKEYRDDQDVVGGFLADKCVINPSIWTPTSMLHAAYASWAHETGADDLSAKALAARLGGRQGITQKRKDTARGWSGVGLRSERSPFDEKREG